MAGTATGRVALFSIHPRYAQAILDGTKQVEFRRQGLPDDVTHVVIYATAPAQHVVGMFEIDDIERLPPTKAWSRFNRVGGIDKTAFERYYSGADFAYVIKVSNPSTFPTPFTLNDIAENLRPPQSYMYLRDEDLDRVRDLTEPSDSAGVRVRRVLASVASRVLAPVGR